MIPIRDHSRTDTFPIVNHLLLGINIMIFVYMFILSPNILDSFVNNYSLIPADIVRGRGLHTLITSMFLHGGLGHIFSNMIFLNVFGDNLEERFGHLGYLVFYLFAGLGGSILQIMFNSNSTIPNLGASGAIAGLLGGYLLLFPNNKIDVLVPIGFIIRTATVPASFMLLYWIGFQFLQGIGTLGVDGGGVAYFAHIGGFVAGAIMTLVLKPLTTKDTDFEGDLQ